MNMKIYVACVQIVTVAVLLEIQSFLVIWIWPPSGERDIFQNGGQPDSLLRLKQNELAQRQIVIFMTKTYPTNI